MNRYILLILISSFFYTQSIAQQMGFGVKGGLLVGTQQGKRALISYHGDLFFETLGKWQGENRQRRLGFVVQLGYHRRGASYNSGIFGSSNVYVASDLFHNFSLATSLKGNFKFGNFLPYYSAGVRLDITPGNEFAQVINPRDAQGVTFANFGFALGGGIEWEPVKLPFGIFLELSIHPDVTPQIFFAKGTLIEYYDYYSQQKRYEQMTEDYKVLNVSIELTLGIKFIKRKNTDTPES